LKNNHSLKKFIFRGRTLRKDSFVSSGEFFLSDDVFLSETSTSAPTINGQDPLVETPLIVSDVSLKPRPTFVNQSENQNSEKQSLETTEKEQPTEMPQYDNSELATGNRFKEGDRTWKGIVYSKKNHKKGKDELTQQHSHDSEPEANQKYESVLGNFPPLPNSQSESSD